MELQGSLQSSEEPATCREPHKPRPHHSILLLQYRLILTNSCHLSYVMEIRVL